MTEDRSNAITLGALGILSGASAWLLINLARASGVAFDWGFFDHQIFLGPVSLIPGATFGMIIGFLLQRRGKLAGFGLAGYVAATLLAYFCACHIAMHIVLAISDALFEPSKDPFAMGIGGIVAGFAGSALLGGMTVYLLGAPSRLLLRLPVLVGTLVGALLAVTANDRTRYGWSILAFFVLWQSAYAASLAPLLRTSRTVAR